MSFLTRHKTAMILKTKILKTCQCVLTDDMKTLEKERNSKLIVNYKKKITITQILRQLGQTNTQNSQNKVDLCPQPGYTAGFQFLDLYSTYQILSSSIMTSSFVWNQILLLCLLYQLLVSRQWEDANIVYSFSRGENREPGDIIVSNRFPNNNPIVYRRYLWSIVGATLRACFE